MAKPRNMRSLLVVDDEEAVLYSFQKIFAGAETTVLTAQTGAEGLQKCLEDSPDVVVLDLQLPDCSGMDVFRQIRAVDARKPVLFITAHGTTATAIEAMKNGAFDYLVKPVDLERLSQLLERAFDAARLMNVPAVLPDDDREDRIVGRSPIMQEMCKMLGRIAPQNVNVLIRGESGTGKELVARAIYHNSPRSEKAFLAINCAAIPEALLESELFGHEEGAFTGANRRRIGKFEQCDGGTLFLDEIGDMAPALQAKILRVLQDQRFERLGSNQLLQTNVRVLAATNQNLEDLVQQGKFRKDLYYRLKGSTIRVPPLRERMDDVAELAHYFLFRFNRSLGLDVRSFDPQVLSKFQAYSWPGNVRELESVIKEGMINASGHVFFPEFLPRDFLVAAGTPSEIATTVASPSTFRLEELVDELLKRGVGDVYAKVLEGVDRIVLSRALRHTHGHLSQTSKLLGLNRRTLRMRMQALGLVMDKVVTEAGWDEEEPPSNN